MERSDAAPSRPPNPAMPYREDCWSEGETSILVVAWGDRYLELNRGNLRQKQWQEVADAVNVRHGGGRRPMRNDVQCKNRIDTLKKKYKIEKAKIADGAFISHWPFYSRLDRLIGSAVPAKKYPASPPLALPLPSHRKGRPLPAAVAAAAAAAVRSLDALPNEKCPDILHRGVSFFRRNFPAAAAAEAAGDSRSSSRSSPSSREMSMSSRQKRVVWRKRLASSEDIGIRQLAKAVKTFSVIYEKVESDKQQQMIELEKQRLEFIKGLEFKRMQIFADIEVQLKKIKRGMRTDTGEQQSSSDLPFRFSVL